MQSSTARRSRPGVRLRARAMPPRVHYPFDLMRIGIDLGGTKVEVIALGEEGAELYRQRIPAPRGVYADSVQAICNLVLEAERKTGAKGSVGLGIPGMLSRATGLVKNANSTWLIGKPLRQD